MVNMKKTVVAAAALMLYANGANAGQTFVEVPVMIHKANQ